MCLFSEPSAPVDVQISQVMPTSLVVSWRIPLRPNGKITSFKVRVVIATQYCALVHSDQPHVLQIAYTAQDSVRVEYSQYLSQGGMWRLTELTPNTLYSIEVTAVNSKGEGPFSPSYRLTTAEQTTEPRALTSCAYLVDSYHHVHT